MPRETQQIAMLIYPGFTALDLVAPQTVFASLMKTKVHLVAKSREPVTSDTGISFLPTATFGDCAERLEILFVPGGGKGTVAQMTDDDTLDVLLRKASGVALVTSVCTGSLVLGAAGLLHGYRATSHWAVLDVLAQLGARPIGARVVEDRNRITGAGVTAGMDLGLRIAAKLRGDTYAAALSLANEYDPQPPFAGSLARASREVATIVSDYYAPLVASARAAADQARLRRPG